MNIIKKIESFCAVLLFICMLLVLLGFMSCCLSGCAQPIYKEEIKIGIVDACYTVLEYDPVDTKDRIQNYLNSRELAGELTEKERRMIDICIERTKISTKWGKCSEK